MNEQPTKQGLSIGATIVLGISGIIIVAIIVGGILAWKSADIAEDVALDVGKKVVEQGIEINVNTTESLSFETANGSQSKFIERISIKDLTEINENLSQYKIHGGYSYIESWTPFILEKDGSAKLLLVYKELRDIGGHGTIVDYYLTAIEIDDNNIRSLVDEDTYLGDEFTVKGITFSLQQPPKVYVVLSDEQIVEIYDVISSGNMITFVPIE